MLTKLSFYHYEKYRQDFAICLLTPKQGPLIYHSLHFLCCSSAILSEGILPENHPLAPLHLPSVPWNKGKWNCRSASCQAGLNFGVSRTQPRGEQSFLFHCSWKFSLYAQIHFQAKKKLSLIKCHEYTRSVLQKLDPWLVYTNSHSEYFTSVFCLQQHFQRMLITLPVYGLLVPSSFYEKECSPIFKSLSFLFL